MRPMIAVLILAALYCDCSAQDVSDRPLTGSKLIIEMKKVMRRTPAPETKIQEKATIKALQQSMKDLIDGKLYEFKSSVNEVDWARELARIQFGAKKVSPTRLGEITVRSQNTISFPMSESEAGGIRLRTPIEISGRIRFHPKDNYGSYRPPDHQELMSIYVGNGAYLNNKLGKITMHEYVIKIQGRDDYIHEAEPVPVADRAMEVIQAAGNESAKQLLEAAGLPH